jgi:MFS family permease
VPAAAGGHVDDVAAAVGGIGVALTDGGKLTLTLLCAVAFLDFVDASIVNVALPSIRHALHFSVQGLQRVPSAYLLTYGGFMLLGGRAADLLGLSSLVGGLDTSVGVLVGARLGRVSARR